MSMDDLIKKLRAHPQIQHLDLNNPMSAVQNDVHQFIEVVKKESVGVGSYPGRWMSEKSKQLCVKLIKEEVGELMVAIEEDNWPEIIDGAADSIFVILYLMAKTGIDLGPYWDEVCRTNLAKAGGPKDPATGKQLKPPGWKPPAIEQMLRESRERFEELLDSDDVVKNP